MMIACLIFISALLAIILASKSGFFEKGVSIVLAIVLAFTVITNSAYVEEAGKASVLQSLGYTECTKEELYEMSGHDKDRLPHTYSLDKGIIIYWKLEGRE